MKNFAGISTPATSSSSDKPRLKVCHVAATAEGGIWLVDQLRELRDRHSFDVVAVISGAEGSLAEKLRAANIRYHAVARIGFQLGPIREIGKMFAAVIELVRFFRRERFDVVQTQLFLTMLSARPAAWIADVPVRIEMLAGPYSLQAVSSRAIERLTYWMDSAVIPTSSKMLELSREAEIGENHLVPIIYYGSDERRFDPARLSPANIRAEFGWVPETPIVCLVAFFYGAHPVNRWVPSELHNRALKGHEDLVRAAPTILREFPNAKFLFVGSGWFSEGEKYLAEVRQLVEDLKLEESVIFTGYRADVNQILREATVAVQASLVENLGGTIEALLMARPTVATRGTGMMDTVRDGQTGVVVNPSDPDDLARGILELLRDQKRAQALGEAGRKLMLERFTLKRTGDDLAQLYDRLLSEKSSGRKFYNPLVSCLRSLIAVPILLFIAFRYIFMDLYLPLFLRSDLASFRSRLYQSLRYSPQRLGNRVGRLRNIYRTRT